MGLADGNASAGPIVILAGRSDTSYLLINDLAARFNVAHVIFEAPHFNKMLRYRLRTLGPWVVAGQLLFLVWDRLWIRPRSRAFIQRLLANYDLRPPDGRIPTTDVESINTPETWTLLQSLQPRVVVVSGTGIIGKRALGLAPIFINIHCGITPRYRGVHGAFWAVVEGRPDLAGVTVHQVDAGVDTGAILGQTSITVEPGLDTYRTLPVKQYLAGLPLMAAAVRDALEGHLTPTPPADGLESRQWFSPTPGDYARFHRQLQALAGTRARR